LASGVILLSLQHVSLASISNGASLIFAGIRALAYPYHRAPQRYYLIFRGIDRVQAQYSCFLALLSLRVPLRVFVEQLERAIHQFCDRGTANHWSSAWRAAASFRRDDPTVFREYDDYRRRVDTNADLSGHDGE
jgi:hypothetical protein